MKITPTLNFGGQCREAIHLYEQAFNGQITCLITYRDANDPAYMPCSPKNRRTGSTTPSWCWTGSASS